MKKHAFTVVWLVMIILSSCQSSSSANLSSVTTSSQSSASSSLSSGSSLISSSSTTTSNSSLSSAISSEASSSSIPQETLVDDELSYLSTSSYYGNTNGNANNHGLVVYDRTNKRHYYAIGTSVYSYNPISEVTSLLFTSTAGPVRNLTLTTNDLFYVATDDLYLRKYNFANQTSNLVYSNKTSYVSRYNNYVYANMTKIDDLSNETQGLGIYRADNQTTMTNFSSGVTNVNITGTKIIYTTNNGPDIQLMADTFIGKTTLKSFADQNFTEISTLHLISESSSSPYTRVFGLIMRNNVETKLYTYNSETAVLTSVATGLDITSLNSDGTYLYFIQNRELYRYHLVDSTLEKIMNLYQDSQHLLIINYWIYFSNDDLTALYRIHPDTGAIQTSFWL